MENVGGGSTEHQTRTEGGGMSISSGQGVKKEGYRGPLVTRRRRGGRMDPEWVGTEWVKIRQEPRGQKVDRTYGLGIVAVTS